MKLGSLAVFLIAMCWLCGCRTVPMAPVNFSEPGWTLRQGQAIWQPNRTAPELTGELLVAARTNGESFVQFTKNPFPMVTAQTTAKSWRIEFAAAGKKYSAPGKPPARLLWFKLAAQPGTNHILLVNESSGERIEAFLNP